MTRKFNIGLLTLVIALSSVSCANKISTFTRDYGGLIFESLNTASQLADEMVSAQQMSREDRIIFAQKTMLPALVTLDELVSISRNWKQGDPIPTQFSVLVRGISQATDEIALSYGKETALQKTLDNVITRLAFWLEEFAR